jgi:hypothetical protein
MQPSSRGLMRSAILLAFGSSALAACGSSPPGQVAQPAGHSPAIVTAGSPNPYQLYTHCGIDEARIGTRYFKAVTPLSDGQGNPPRGWGNPFQRGTMTALSPTTAVFTNHAGHRVLFPLRPGATRFQHLCS